VARDVANLAAMHDRPIVVQSKYADFESESVSALQTNGVPVFKSIDVAARCLAALQESGRHRRTVVKKADLESQPVERSPTNGEPERLTEVEAREMLDSAGIPVSPWRYVESPGQARQAIDEFDGAAAMKIVSREIPHKSDVGGVVLDVSSRRVESEYDALLKAVEDARPDTHVEGVLMSPMVDEGVELIVGGTVDPEIGPVITLGIGGVFVEVIGDIVARPLPATPFDVRSMIDDLEGRSLLDGSRSLSPVDEDRLVDFLLGFADFLIERPEIAEIDLNPVVASESGLTVLDADIRIT
jgi:acetyltransferase